MISFQLVRFSDHILFRGWLASMISFNLGLVRLCDYCSVKDGLGSLILSRLGVGGDNKHAFTLHACWP